MFSIKCHACGAVYELDESLVGEIAECAECPALFQIVAPPPGSPPGFVATGIPAQMPGAPAPAAPEEEPEVPTAVAEEPAFGSLAPSSPKPPPRAAEVAAEEFTNTVKLKRSKSEGMIPKYNTPWRQGSPGTHAIPKEEKLKDVASVKCPFCLQEYELSKEMVGKEVQCAACNKTFVVPKESFVDRPQRPSEPVKTPVVEPEAPAAKPSFWARFECLCKPEFFRKWMFWKH